MAGGIRQPLPRSRLRPFSLWAALAQNRASSNCYDNMAHLHNLHFDTITRQHDQTTTRSHDHTTRQSL